MFTIQYEAIDGTHKMQHFDSSNRTKLLIHLCTFSRPIVAVYEQATVITKTVRKELGKFPASKSRYAKEFTNQP